MRFVPSRQGVHLPQDSILAEIHEESGHIDGALVFIHDNQAAGTHNSAKLDNFFRSQQERLSAEIGITTAGWTA